MVVKLMFTLVFTLIFMAANAIESPSAQIATDGLISYWTFDEADIDGNTVEDVCGENHGTINGAPKTVEGRVGQAMEFDGASFAEVADSESLKPDEYTVEAWVKISSPQGAWHCCWVVTKEHGQAGYGMAVGTQQPAIYHSDGNAWRRLESGVEIELNEWHHIAGTYDGKTVRVYVDGVLKNSMEYGFAHTPRPLLIGSWYGGRFYKGLICEVRVYNRPLSDDEIAQNMKAEGFAVMNPDDKLVLTWGRIKGSRL